MAVFDATSLRQLSDCWFPQELNNGLRHMTPAEIQVATDWIDRNLFEDARSSGRNRFNVTWSVPSDWSNIALEPLTRTICSENDQSIIPTLPRPGPDRHIQPDAP